MFPFLSSMMENIVDFGNNGSAFCIPLTWLSFTVFPVSVSYFITPVGVSPSHRVFPSAVNIDCTLCSGVGSMYCLNGDCLVVRCSMPSLMVEIQMSPFSPTIKSLLRFVLLFAMSCSFTKWPWSLWSMVYTPSRHTAIMVLSSLFSCKR